MQQIQSVKMLTIALNYQKLWPLMYNADKSLNAQQLQQVDVLNQDLNALIKLIHRDVSPVKIRIKPVSGLLENVLIRHVTMH